jgi:phosphatidylglycerophosphate synthase
MNQELPPNADELRTDCYSAREQAAMAVWQKLRGVTLRPALNILASCGIGPGHLTLLSALAGLLFCPLFFWAKPAAFGMIALHVLLDGLDGPLARHTNSASRRGSFTDAMADQLVVVFSTIVLMSTHTVDVLAGSVYVVAYTVVMLFAMARNALSIPYSWLVRPRFFVYAWFVVETYGLPGTIDYVLWFFNLLLIAKAVTGFVKIRSRI